MDSPPGCRAVPEEPNANSPSDHNTPTLSGRCSSYAQKAGRPSALTRRSVADTYANLRVGAASGGDLEAMTESCVLPQTGQGRATRVCCKPAAHRVAPPFETVAEA
jgi:hypothetical protein